MSTRKRQLRRQVELRTWDLQERTLEQKKAHHKFRQSKKIIESNNRQLEAQLEKLQEMDEVKSRFFANIFHEFRIPLALIMGPLEKRLSNCRDKQQEKELKMMLRNSRRLLNLVNQLLELAKFDSGKMKLEASLQDIVSFVKNFVICFESLSLQNKVDLTFHGEEDEILIYFDPEKLEKIITNLLSNAFNYTPAGGGITVSIRKVAETVDFRRGCVEISVRGTGTGIPREQLPYIFDRFYQGKDPHEYKRKGTGIGLALTKELIALHHGDIRVHSSYRQVRTRGTEFIIWLPMGKEHLQPEETAEAVESRDARQFPLLKEPPELAPVSPFSPIDHDFTRELQDVIEKNFSDPDFNVEALCKKMMVSRPTLYRKIQSLSGENPTQFIRSYRLKQAAELLESKSGSVTDVAFEVGFSSVTYFSKCFKEKYHRLPSAFISKQDRCNSFAKEF